MLGSAGFCWVMLDSAGAGRSCRCWHVGHHLPMPIQRPLFTASSLKEVDGLTPRQIQALAALLRGRSISEAAECAGVHRGTVSNWLMTDPIFSGRLKELRNEVLQQVSTSLCNEALRSIQFLGALRDDEAAPVAHRIRAAQTLLATAGIGAATSTKEALTPKEAAILTILANRKFNEVADDREDHYTDARHAFKCSEQGRRLVEVQKSIDELAPQYEALSSKVAEFEKLYAGLPVHESAKHPDYARYKELVCKRNEACRTLNRLYDERRTLRSAERACLDATVLNPDDMLAENLALGNLCKAYGTEAVSAVAAELGQFEGQSAKIGQILAERAAKAKAAEEEKKRASAPPKKAEVEPASGYEDGDSE